MAKDNTLRLKLKAVDRMSNAIDRVQRKFPRLSQSIKRASVRAKIFNAQTKSMRRNLTKLGNGMKRVGMAMTLGITLPLTAAAAQGVRTFGDFQQGLRGIEKTTGLTRMQVAGLGRTFDNLSTRIPVTTGEMLELARVGGQLAVKGVANIEKFTIVMAKLSRASDVVGEDGSKSIARILTVTGDGIGKVDRFAAALVDLGNNAAAGETEILEVANRVAGQIGRFDVGSDKILGMSTALRALGKRAESAGSVIGRAFDAIDQSIKGGGKEIQILSKLTGVAVKDLKQQFKVDAAGVFQKFIEGLSKVQKGGGNLVKVMDALGLKGVRINDVLGTLSKRPEVLAENMERASRAFAENTALQKEFLIQTDSFNSEMRILGNTFSSLLRLIGRELAPAVQFFGGILKSIFNFLRDNPTILALAIVFGVLAAAMGPILFLFGTFLVMLPGLAVGLVALQVVALPVIGTFFAIAATITALIIVSVILVKKWGAMQSFFKENPFGSLLKFVLDTIPPLKLLADILDSISASKGPQGLDGGPSKRGSDERQKGLGPGVGARRQSAGVGQGRGPLRPEAINGQIGVTFANAPRGTRVSSESSGPIGLDLGFVGGLQ